MSVWTLMLFVSAQSGLPIVVNFPTQASCDAQLRRTVERLEQSSMPFFEAICVHSILPPTRTLPTNDTRSRVFVEME